MSARPTLRCAIYTRVSTEHGMAQEFNSLDNQREAAEAYIKSQAHEGWRCLPACYDDGGFSGGSMDRPALQSLLTDIQARRIDVVVVYKVDRLTRSLADFAKLVELFDAHGVSFVSVTQAFNTTSSMGRLTLNVLLSFAPFEREVTGERIRDKIAASKKKGIWMGGVVPLGYRVENRALHIVDEHAAVIREIYARYLDLGSIAGVKADLDRRKVEVPRRTDGTGAELGGTPFSRGHVEHILKSPVYAGRLGHKGQTHEGQHPAIIEPAIWDEVQQKLGTNRPGRGRRPRTSSSHLLVGRIRDHQGTVLSPTHAQKGAHRYRYYVSRALLRGDEPSGIRRIPAPEIEATIVGAIRSAIPASSQPDDDVSLIRDHLALAIVHPDRLELQLTGERSSVTIPWSPAPTRRARDIIVPPGREGATLRRMKAEDRTRILKAIATGRAWMDELTKGRIPSPAAIASREILSERSVRMTLSLAHLAPSILKAIIDGRLPRGIAIRDLADLPPSWAEQECALGM